MTRKPAIVALLSATVVSTVVAVTLLAQRAQTAPQPISNTFIFGQAICLPASPAPPKPQLSKCAQQRVPPGAIIEIQLPGTPSVWTVSSVTGPITQVGEPTRLPSPGRIDGTSEIYRFRFRVNSLGTAQIKMAEAPPFLATPSGVFSYTISFP